MRDTLNARHRWRKWSALKPTATNNISWMLGYIKWKAWITVLTTPAAWIIAVTRPWWWHHASALLAADTWHMKGRHTLTVWLSGTSGHSPLCPTLSSASLAFIVGHEQRALVERRVDAYYKWEEQSPCKSWLQTRSLFYSNLTAAKSHPFTHGFHVIEIERMRSLPPRSFSLQKLIQPRSCTYFSTYTFPFKPLRTSYELQPPTT